MFEYKTWKLYTSVEWLIDLHTFRKIKQIFNLLHTWLHTKNVRLLSFYRLSSPHSICSILPGRLKICRSNLCFSLACFMSCPFLLKVSSHSKQWKSSSTFCFFMFLDYTFVATVWKILNFSSIQSKNFFTWIFLKCPTRFSLYVEPKPHK